MTQATLLPHNNAANGANVGIQAERVSESTVYLNSNVYQTSSNASPREKYEVGVRYLQAGVPALARERIDEAIALGCDDGEVRFHWVLAMLSKRSYRDLTHAERDRLAGTAQLLPKYADDEWRRALEAICDLLHCLRSRVDAGLALKKLGALPAAQRVEVDRHLDLVLTGSMKDSHWAGTREQAENDKNSGNRVDRAWAFFHPKPFEARARQPVPPSIKPGDWISTITWSALCAYCGGYLGWTVLVLARPLPIAALAVALVAGFAAAASGLGWRYRSGRVRAKDREYSDQRAAEEKPEPGFARRVDHSFEHYFAKYAPSSEERDQWLAETAGFRAALRDEIVESYQDSEIPVNRINWLIRYLVTEFKNSWQADEARDYRVRYRTTRSTKVLCSGALAAFGLSVMTVVVEAVSARPLSALLAAFAAFLSGRGACARWFRIISERRRAAEEKHEYAQAMMDRQAEFDRWKARLEATRPSDSEMEYWLYCDKTILLGKALDHYQLPWRDVVAHAFLQVPAPACKRSRMEGGPWRYSKYDIRLFLVTQDGVRDVSGELDFEKASFQSETRKNFRFEAISSVDVIRTGELSYTLALTLTNGPTRRIRVVELEGVEPVGGEDLKELSRMNLDTAGFAHTLHILEGIAADGKNWMDRDPQDHRGPEGSL